MFSDEARLLVRPLRTYAELARRAPTSRPDALGTLFERWLVLVVTLGAFVSFTCAGRLVALHLFSPMVFWAHFVVLPCVVAAAVARVAAPEVKTRTALSLYLAGTGPWLVLLSSASALCLFFDDPGATFRALLARGVPFFAILVALGWGALVVFAFFRAGLGLSRRRALAATVAHHVALTFLVLAWFLFTGQLLPIFR